MAASLAAMGGLVVVLGATGAGGARQDRSWLKHEQRSEITHDVSPPLRSIEPARPPHPDRKKENAGEADDGVPVPGQSASDPVIQSSRGTAAAPALGAGFDGIGQGFTGPAGAFTVGSAPPDPNSAVGPNHIVEIVNSSFAIFNKSGTVLYGPAATNTLWSGFGGGCQANDDGDATVEYDRLADRWVISQFSLTTTPYLECVAVSTSGDPTGSYYRYAFTYTSFPDYPKLAVWPDGYYQTFNLFADANGGAYQGPEVCALDRASMLAGQAATEQCFTLGTTYGGLLPSDLDGATPPPIGSPNFALGFGTNSLLLWKFHVDWVTPASSTFNGPTTIPVASFSPGCNGGGACIRQPGTTQKLDSLADRLMYRLAYRNFGDHESLVVNDSVTANSSVGIRWYELRSPNGTPSVYQQGTFAPDASYRWMGSIAMDGSGDIGLGYSLSSSTIDPSIAYTGRLAGDPLGVMTQGEGTIVTGTGTQRNRLNRWGDYTSMAVDPSDDCTFWYTNEYLAANGSYNWHTRIASFKFPSCGAAVTNDFSLSASPASLSLAQGASSTTTLSSAVTLGVAQQVALSASGAPAGVTVSFAPASVTAGSSSTMTVTVGPAVATGSYTITVTGTGTGAAHTTSVGLTVTASDFSVSASPSTLSIAQGAGGTSQIATARTSGVAQSVALSASGAPGGTTVSFSPASVTAGGSSTMTVTAGSSTTAGTYSLTVTATGASVTHTTAVSLTVTASGGGGGGSNIVANPGFETGSLSSWSASGAFTPVVKSGGHSGSYSAQVGSTGAVNGNSTLTQTVTLPAGNPQLTFWYQPHCPDTIQYDQMQLQIRSTGGSTLATVLNSCTNTGAWTQVSYDLTSLAGQTVVLWFNDHDDGYAGDPTYFLLDDVSVAGGSPPPPSDFSISASPSSLSVAQGANKTSTISTAVTSGAAQSVALTASGAPSGVTVSFSPATVTAGASSTMTVAAGSSAAPGSYTITVTGTGAAATHTTTVGLTVTAVTADFSLGASPSSLSIAQGANGTSTISTAVTAGSAQPVALSATGAPSGVTVSFNPASVTAGGSSTVTITAGSTAATGTSTITVTGTGSSATHATTISLTVTAAGGGGTNAVVNGGFEGGLNNWSASGAFLPLATSVAHTGGGAAQVGSTGAVNGASTLTQTVRVPTGSPQLTFWYQPNCPDTIQYDQMQMQIRSTGGSTLATVLNACTNTGTWTQVTYDLTPFAGQTVVLWFNDNDDGYAIDPTFFRLDDVFVG